MSNLKNDFPVGTNIKCTLGWCEFEEGATWKAITTKHVSADDGKSLYSKLWLPSEGDDASRVERFLRNLNAICMVTGVDKSQIPTWDNHNDFEQLDSVCEEVSSMIRDLRGKSQYYIKTIVKENKKGERRVDLGYWRFISFNPDLEYIRDENKLNHIVLGENITEDVKEKVAADLDDLPF